MSLKRTVYVGPYLECRVGEIDVDHWDASEAIREALHHVEFGEDGDVVVWLPNEGRDGCPDRPTEIDEDVAIDLTSRAYHRDEANWFAEAFAGEIAVLAGLYGAGNVATRWGVVAYTS